MKEPTLREKAIRHMIENIEDFGEEKYKRTGETQCIGRLAYSCINLGAVIEIINIMDGKTE